MTNRVIDFKTSKLLKSLGFEEPCSAYYEEGNEDHLANFNKPIFRNFHSSSTITCPTISQVLDWLWFNKDVHIEVFVNDDRTFGVIIARFDSDGKRLEDGYAGMYHSRTEAELAAIKVALTLI